MRLSICFAGLLLTQFFASGVAAAPYIPSSDQQVLEVLPARAADPRMREMRELRRALAEQPDDVEAAVRLARRYFEEVAAEGDPRYVGYAQAALAPWWDLPEPPLPVRLQRAVLLQFSHQFDAALADLDAIVKVDPLQGEAWAWDAAIRLVRADYAGVRNACAQMAALASPLIAMACRAQVDAVTGHAVAAAAALQAGLTKFPQARPHERLWVLTRLAETEERLGRPVQAEAAFRSALALGISDGYLQAAYADFLLDQQRPAEVLVLLKDKSRSDLLLLRLALAAKALNNSGLSAWQDELTARFDAARLRGDSLHQKEEARFALALLGQPARAVQLASQNYQLQREPADARILLEAALAAKQPAAAAPVLAWMASSGVESQALQALAAQMAPLAQPKGTP
ncbi:hypothetical protein ACVBEH_10475 [Roseateles sp. GG27B]